MANPKKEQRLAYIVNNRYKPLEELQRAGFEIVSVHPVPGKRPAAVWLLLERQKEVLDAIL